MRWILPLFAIGLLTFQPALSKPLCEPNSLETNTAIQNTFELVESGNSKGAIREAAIAVSSSEDCVLSHLTMAKALRSRLDEVSGLSALSVSRKYKRSIARALELEPNNIDARTLEIRFLIHAPKIAGGNRSKARIKITNLKIIDQTAAAELLLQLARTEAEPDDIIAGLRVLLNLQPEKLRLRRELARRLVLAERYVEADAEVEIWTELTGSDWLALEALYLQGVMRVRGNYELDIAEMVLAEFVERRPDVLSDILATSAQAQTYIGDIRRIQNDPTGSKKAYTRALVMDPDNERAKNGLIILNVD